ncbi:acyl-CoA thioesterase [Kerstersia similis]|uniref:acyl-CoA thioesterase n=1 Tax=Kerstersia similis TaxID=206505 RepID=UPI0039EE798A
MSHQVHAVPIDVLFRHCDPAGIVFYPRYVEILHDIVEHWFNHGLRIGYENLHGQYGLGIPTASLHVEFKAPSRLGEHLTGRLTVEKMGRSSMHLNIDLCGLDGAVRVEGKAIVVFASIAELSPVEIPPDFRALISPYRRAASTSDA